MQKKYKISFIYCLLVVCWLFTGCLGSTTFAQSPTPEETPTPEVTQVDDAKIKEIRNQVREKIQEKIQAIKEKGKRRAYVGQILSLDGLEITLDTRRGEREITADEEATIVGAKRKEIDLEDLEVDDQIICMGFVDAEGEMIAKRIVAIPRLPKPPTLRRAVFGQVIEGNGPSLIIVHPQKEGISYEVEATSETTITKKVDGKMQEVKFSEIETDDRLVAIGTWDEDEEILTAKLIHVISGKAKGLTE